MEGTLTDIVTPRARLLTQQESQAQRHLSYLRRHRNKHHTDRQHRHYEFTDVSLDFYDITATKPGYWPGSDSVTVTAEEPTTANILLCQKGDLNTNGGQADANRRISNDGRCNRKHNPTGQDIRPEQQWSTGRCRHDLRLLKNVSVGVAELE